MKHRAQSIHFFLSLAVVGVLMVPVAAASPAGMGPDDALVPPDDWEQLYVGESRWYAFHYAGDGSQVQVRLQIEPEEGAAFEVWTPEGIRDWRLGLEAQPIGRGSADPYAQGVLSWSGSFNIEGTYGVVVEHTGSQPGASYFLLEIRGEGVSLAPSKPTATPQPEPTEAQPKPAAPSNVSGKLVFQTTFGGFFYVVNADGSGLRRITDGMDPVWSPNGRQIAFARWREPRGVWVVNVDDAGAPSGERRVFDWDQARWPSWSPDGSEILFSRQHGGRTEEIERCFWGFCFTLPPHPHWKMGVVRLADGAFYEPAASQFSLAPDWSPAPPESGTGGARMVYADEHGLRVQSKDGEVSYLITHDAQDTGPAWSPDGGRVAFTRRQHDHWEVYVVDVDGRDLTRLTSTPMKPDGSVGNSASPVWSPDGHFIAFLTDRIGKWEIWVMRADGTKQHAMFESALDGLTLEYAHLGERAISWAR